MAFGMNGLGGMGSSDLIGNLGRYGAKKPVEPKQAEKKEAQDAALYARKNEMTEKAGQSDSKVSLSEGAQKILDEMKEKFGNTDFYVADFANDEEAGQILSNSTKEYGVVIKPEELEKMAQDAEYKEKILNTISDAQEKLDDFRENLPEDQKGAVKRVGFSIGENGAVSYFAELEKAGKAQSERIKQQRAEKAEEEKEKEKAEAKKEEDAKLKEKREQPPIRQYVKADNLEDLSSKIADFLNADESSIIAARPHIDFSA